MNKVICPNCKKEIIPNWVIKLPPPHATILKYSEWYECQLCLYKIFKNIGEKIGLEYYYT